MNINNNKMNIALITGITGQDGSYLAEYLIELGYKVYGIVRRNSSVFLYERLEHIRDKLHLFYGDLTDALCIYQIITKIIEENKYSYYEIYNLGAQSHVGISFQNPTYTVSVDAMGALNILEVIAHLPVDTRNRFRYYQAGTSEMYGKVLQTPQNELTPFNPQSPYACAKVFAHNITVNYREAYNIFACNGILFNHESPRRGKNFVTQKIIDYVKLYKNGATNNKPLELGNLYSKRDWGHAKDYIIAMYLMLQQKKPDDYVVSTGKTTTVKDFVEKAFNKIGVEIKWKGEGLDEKGYNKENNDLLITINKKYFRPCEVDLLLGDSSKIRRQLGWIPYYDLDGLIGSMLYDEK